MEHAIAYAQREQREGKAMQRVLDHYATASGRQSRSSMRLCQGSSWIVDPMTRSSRKPNIVAAASMTAWRIRGGTDAAVSPKPTVYVTRIASGWSYNTGHV